MTRREKSDARLKRRAERYASLGKLDRGKFFSGFKSFITRGNIVDMAVGIILGAAFTKIVNSLVGDIVMPCIASLTGRLELSGRTLTLVAEKLADDGQVETAAVLLRYGQFFQYIFDFLVTAFFIYLAMRLVNRVRRRQEAIRKAIADIEAEKNPPPPPAPAAPPEPSAEESLLREISGRLETISRSLEKQNKQ